MADKLTKIEIDFGSGWEDVTTYIREWKYNGTLDNIADIITLKFVKTIKDNYTIIHWLPIRVYEGWDTSTDRLIFQGVITRTSDEYNYLVIDCADETYKLLRTELIAVYNSSDVFAGKISAIAQDIIESIGLTAIVEDTGTDIIIDQFVINDNTDALERLTALAKIVDYNILYDPEVNTIYFVSKGYFTNPNLLTLSDDVVTRPKWDEDATRLYNDLTVKGGTTSAVRTKLFSGDGSTVEFDIDIIPSDSVKVEVDSGAGFVEKTQGTIGVSSSFDYSIDKFNKKIRFNVSSTPPSGTDNTRVTISGQIPPVVNVINESSIDKYYVGRDVLGNKIGIKKTIILDDITSVDDALNRANKLLGIFSVPFLSTQITLKPSTDKTTNYKLGEVIPVTDLNKGFSNKNFVITEVERTYPGAGAKLTLGDKAYKLGQTESDFDARIKRLESRLSGDYDVLNGYRNFNHNITVERTSISYDIECICDSFILGHPVNGLLGQGIILDDFETNFTSNWSGSGFTLAEETSNILVGSKSGKLTFSASGTHTITSTQVYGDLSSYVGVSSGLPNKGTIGIWINNNSNTITNPTLIIGSSASDYLTCVGTIFQSDIGFGWQNDYTYIVFDLDSGSVTGTIDWTNVDYSRISMTLAESSGDIYIDYFTISMSNYIGLNGLGYRTMTKTGYSITY